MKHHLNKIAALPTIFREGSVKLDNRTPFPVKLFHRNKASTERFCNLLHGYSRYEQPGRRPIIYADRSFADHYLEDPRFDAYPLWIAEYRRESEPLLCTVCGAAVPGYSGSIAKRRI